MKNIKKIIDIKKEEIKKENDKFRKIVNSYAKATNNYNFIFDDLTEFFNYKFLVNNTKIITLLMIAGIIYNNENNTNIKTFSLLYCDIDGLKNINDTLGHTSGDEGIKRIANIIKNSIRIKRKSLVDSLIFNTYLNKNMIFRIGGDEFLIILPNCTKEDAEDKVVKRIKVNIKKKLRLISNLSLSIGVADTTEIEIPNNLSDKSITNYFESLIKLAEKRMYDNKNRIRTNISEKEKINFIIKNIFRISNSLGIKINNDSDFYILLDKIKKVNKNQNNK